MKIKLINGQIIDGTGAKAYPADLLIDDDKIIKIGDCSRDAADRIIDASGCCLAPGFIDVHTHSDLSVLYDGSAENRIYDGVTTDVCGNCGIGPAPVSKEHEAELMSYLKTRIVGNIDAELKFSWRSFAEYLDYMAGCPIAVNMVPILAEGAVRICVMGMDQREATEAELEKMKGLVREAMEAGAVGMSSGLIYLPGAYVKKPEMTELCKIVKEYDGFYTTHIRDEGDREEEALQEAFDVAEGSGVRLNISHLKLTGVQNFHKTDMILRLFKEAEDRGITLTCDQYPYNSGMTSLMAMLPPWVSKNGIDQMLEDLKSKDIQQKILADIENGIPGWQNLCRTIGGFSRLAVSTVTRPEHQWMEGMYLPDAAARLGMTTEDYFFRMLIEEHARTLVLVEGMSQEDVDFFASRPDIMVGSDSATLSKTGPLSKGKPHPRGYGSHAHFISEFVRKKQLISLEAAVRKMSALEADHLHLEKRGYLKEGYFADVIVFDPDKVQDHADIIHPREFSSGFEYVIVNRAIDLDEGVQTPVRAGRVLRRCDQKIR